MAENELMRFERYISRAVTLARNLRAKLDAPAAQRTIWVCAVALFIGGLAYSLAAKPTLLSDIRLDTALIILFVLSPLMTLANMATTKELGRLAGAHLSYSAALKLAVMSTALNHLPAPGGPLLRIAAFQSAGAKISDSTLATIAAGLLWMAATFLLAALWAIFLHFWLGAVFLLTGVGMAGASAIMAKRLPGGWESAARLFIISGVSAGLYAIAIYYALMSFGVSWPFGQAAVISAAGVIGAAVSIAPSGLGVREAASAGLATIIGAEPTAAFTATAAIHLAMLAVMCVCALFFASQNERSLAVKARQ